MNNRYWQAAAWCASGVIGAVGPTYAQDSTDSSATDYADIAEVVVTARRTEERLQDVPISITVFNQEQLADRNVVSSNDLVTFTPSLTSNSRFGDETASFALRGFVQDPQTSPSVAVYFADVAAPRAQGGTGGGNGAGVGSFFDLQNVQVLKGPQGTLFGRNTTGGAILLVPTKPTSLTEGYVEGSVGNYNMRRVQGVFNTPLGESVRVRFGVDHQTRDGYLENKSGLGPDDFQDTNYVAARASLVADVTPNLETYFVFQYSNSDTNGGLPRVIASNTTDDCSPLAAGAAGLFGPLVCSQMLARAAAEDYGYWDVENDNTNPMLEIEQTQLINTTTWLATDTVTLKNIVSYSEFTQAQNSAIFGSNLVFPPTFGAIAGLPFGYVSLYKDPERDNVSQKSFTEELQLQGNASELPLTYQAGAYYESSKPLKGFQGSYSPILLSCFDPEKLQCADYLGAGFLQNSLTKYEFENIGFYAQSTYDLTSQLSLTTGLRYTIDKTTATGATRQYRFPLGAAPTVNCAIDPTADATDPDNCALSGSQKSKEPTWLVNLDYKPIQDIMVYAKYARGYRQGSVNSSNSFVVSWEPEKVDAYEIGAKTSFRGPVSGYLNLAAFYNDFQNQQLAAGLVPDGTDPNAAPAQAIVNAGTSTIQGFELDGSLLPGAGFSLNFGYTYLDTKLKSYDAPSFPGYQDPLPNSPVGGNLALAPEHKLSVTAAYALPLDASIGDMTLSATYSHTAEQTAVATSPYGILPATDLWNANFRWAAMFGGPIDLSAFVTNLTNEKYPVYVGGSWQSSGYETFILGQPRMYGVRLRYSFDA